MANQSILNAFERFWQHTVNALGAKADKSEVPTQVSQLENDENFIKEDYDLVISLNEWDNYTIDDFEIVSGTLSAVYEKYQSEIVPRVLLKRDFVYNSDYSVELYESKSVAIGFGSNKFVSIIFDDVASHGYFNRTKTFSIYSYGDDVDNNIITRVDFTKDNHSVEIEFEMPYGSYPNEMAIEHFTYNSDDIGLIYDTLYYNTNTDFANVLLKGIYYFGTEYNYPVNVEASNVYIRKATTLSTHQVYIDFTVPVMNDRFANITLRFDSDSNGVFTLAYVGNNYKVDPYSIAFTNNLSGKMTVISDTSKCYPALNMVFVNTTVKFKTDISSGDSYTIGSSPLTYPSGYAPVSITALSCSGTNATSKGLRVYAQAGVGIAFFIDSDIAKNSIFNISGWYEVASS